MNSYDWCVKTTSLYVYAHIFLGRCMPVLTKSACLQAKPTVTAIQNNK